MFFHMKLWASLGLNFDWDLSKCDAKQGLKSICALMLVFPCCSMEPWDCPMQEAGLGTQGCKIDHKVLCASCQAKDFCVLSHKWCLIIKDYDACRPMFQNSHSCSKSGEWKSGVKDTNVEPIVLIQGNISDAQRNVFVVINEEKTVLKDILKNNW